VQITLEDKPVEVSTLSQKLVGTGRVCSRIGLM
jgi:hypothetical protein